MVVKIINHLINRQLQQHYCYKLELLCQEEGNYVFSLPKLCKHSTPRASSTKFYFRYRNIYSIYLLTLYSVAYGIGIMNRICQNIPSNLHLICCRLFILDPLTLSFGQEMIILVSISCLKLLCYLSLKRSFSPTLEAGEKSSQKSSQCSINVQYSIKIWHYGASCYTGTILMEEMR